MDEMIDEYGLGSHVLFTETCGAENEAQTIKHVSKTCTFRLIQGEIQDFKWELNTFVIFRAPVRSSFSASALWRICVYFNRVVHSSSSSVCWVLVLSVSMFFSCCV